jgi:hypothetical protein
MLKIFETHKIQLNFLDGIFKKSYENGEKNVQLVTQRLPYFGLLSAVFFGFSINPGFFKNQ